MRIVIVLSNSSYQTQAIEFFSQQLVEQVHFGLI